MLLTTETTNVINEESNNAFDLQFFDRNLENRFRSHLLSLEYTFTKYFVWLLIVFNIAYAIKDGFFETNRALISVQVQALVVIPVNILFWYLFTYRIGRSVRINVFGLTLFIFTFFSQLGLILLNGTDMDALAGVMLVVTFACYSFSGMIYKHLLIITPMVVISLLLVLLVGRTLPINVIVNDVMLYCLTFTGVLLIKYRTESHQRTDFYNTKVVLSENQQLKRNLEKINSQSDLRKNIISVLAHDVRSPIANLQSILQLTKNNTISSEETELYLMKLDEQVSMVNYLINDILVWVKSQNEDIQLDWMPFDLDKCTRDLSYIFKDQISAKRITFSSDLEIKSVTCQPEMMKAILRNLIGNAIKFSSEGGGIAIRSEDHGKEVRVVVEDKGVGMTAENLARLQHSFSTKLGTNMEAGTGLGLKICQSLVKAHNAELEISSEIHRGTEISFRLKK